MKFLTVFRSLQDKIEELQNTSKNHENEIIKIKINSVKLKQALSLNSFNVDALKQYGRRENIRIHNPPQKTGNRVLIARKQFYKLQMSLE